MNKTLYNRKVKIPQSLILYLEKSFGSVEGNANVEGYNRNQELRSSGIATYQQLKRIKGWFDSYSGDKKDAPFILNGGDRMNKWCNEVLSQWRNSVDRSKSVKSVTSPKNEYIKDHEKSGGSVNPHDSHLSGINKYDTAITEQIKKINKLMKNLL
jgi:hypothetical protein